MMRWLFLMAGFAIWTANAWSADAAPAPAAEPEIELEGVVVQRSGGGFMTITMNGPALKFSFFDDKKKAVPPDVDRALVRLQPAGRNPERRVLVRSADGQFLTHGQPIRPPHVFKLFISLVREGSDEAVETYTVDFP